MKKTDYVFIKNRFNSIRKSKDKDVKDMHKWMMFGYMCKLEKEDEIEPEIKDKLFDYASHLSIYDKCLER